MNKFNVDQWLTATQAETYLDSEGMTLPVAVRLLQQASLDIRPRVSSLTLFDIGAGLGQVTEALHRLQGTNDMKLVKVVDGEIDDGLIAELHERKTSRGWSSVEITKVDATDMQRFSDETFDYVFGNFVYFLVKDPLAAFRETRRVLRHGGTIAFSTWAYSGPFHLLAQAQAHLPDYPLTPPSSRLNGHWNHPVFIRATLEELGFEDIRIEQFSFRQTAESPSAMARKMWHAVILGTNAWGDVRREKGWELFAAMERVLEEQPRENNGGVGIGSIALVVTAKVP